MSCIAQQGDSGGPVYIVTEVVNGHVTCKLLGIISSGIINENNEITATAFSKYYYIVNELGVEAITE